MKIIQNILKSLVKAKNWFLKRSLPLKIFIIVVLVGLGWFTYSRIQAAGKSQVQYQTATAEKGTLIVSLSESGQVSTANNTTVTTQVSGAVSKVYVANGDKVTAGQKLAEINLDQPSLLKQNQAWASYLSAKNSLNSANSSAYTLDASMWAANQKFINDAVARGLPTWDPTYIQEHDAWMSAEASYKNQFNSVTQSQIAVNNAWLNYQQSSSTVIAPIAGTVSDLSLRPGAVITVTSSSSNSTSVSEKLATIRTPGAPSLLFSISEMDAPQIKNGNKATITFDALPDKTFTGKIVSIDTTGSVTSGVTNYQVTILLDTDSPEIFPNMSATANIITDSKTDVIIVPNSAIQNLNGQTTVRVLKNGQLSSVPVQTGLASDTQTEIVSGISEGTEVVTAVINSSSTTTSSSSSPFSGGVRIGGGSFGGGAVRTPQGR